MTITINSIEVTPAMIRYDANGVWVGEEFTPSHNPRLDFAQLLTMFTDEGKMYGNIHSRTKYDPRKVQIGLNTVIGGCGFGYVHNIPIPHLGGVVIEDGVIIGSNCCIDRGVIGDTVIGADTRIDNLVHIAHNAVIGNRCFIVAGTVIGGSVVIGHDCFIGINASIKNKVKIGNGCTIGMGAVVTRDVEAGLTVIGNPAKPLIK